MISVLLPYRNAAGQIAEAIRSILEQSVADFELLAVDDGSVDESTEIVASFDDRRMVSTANARAPGIVGALSTALDRARGGWIARMDADDVAHPHRFARQIASAEKLDLDVVGCPVRLIDSAGEGMERYVEWVNSITLSVQFSAARFVECPVIHPAAMIRRDKLLSAGGYLDVPWAEDHDLWLRMLENGCRFGSPGGKPLLDWRDSPTRLTRIDDRYGGTARNKMRCHYLSRLPIVRERGVVISGAGPIGKAMALGLQDLGVLLHGFLEVNPRRIGQRIHGVPVVHAADLNGHWPDAVLLGAVGIPGGREPVRRLAVESGRAEGSDFWPVC